MYNNYRLCNTIAYSRLGPYSLNKYSIYFLCIDVFIIAIHAHDTLPVSFQDYIWVETNWFMVITLKQNKYGPKKYTVYDVSVLWNYLRDCLKCQTSIEFLNNL